MDAAKRIREKVGRAGEKFPNQEERLVKCADVIIERGAEPLHKAYEKQLNKIMTMNSEDQAAEAIGKIEHTVFESSVMSPFLGARESKSRARFWIMVLIGILFFVAFVGATAPSLMRFL